MTLSGADVTNAAVPMLDVVPIHEASGPGASVIEVGKAFGRKLRAVLGGAKQRFRISIVIADPGSRIGRFDAQPVQHRQHRGCLECRAVVTVQDGLAGKGGNAFGQRRTAHQMRRMIGVIAVMEEWPRVVGQNFGFYK